jgi:glycosyltransferase involved in cell wall biosynthesis
VIACSGKTYADAHPYVDEMRADGLDVKDILIPRSIEPVADVGAFRQMGRLIAREKPDLVHTHLAKAGIIGRLAARRSGVPSVHTVYDYAFVDESGLRRRLYLEAERRAARWTRRILFISSTERDISEAEKIGEPAQLVTMGFGVDLERFAPDRVDRECVAAERRELGIGPESIVVGTVARLVARKQVDMLMRVVADLRRSRPALRLLIVGGGPLEQELRGLARDLGIEADTTFTGFVDDEARMPQLYAAMDVFCLLSRREGYGMAAAEAGAMGKAAVALDIAPVNQVVREGETGFLVRDASSAASRLAALVDDPALRARMGSAGQMHVQRECNLRDRFELVLDVYRDVLKSPART